MKTVKNKNKHNSDHILEERFFHIVEVKIRVDWFYENFIISYQVFA